MLNQKPFEPASALSENQRHALVLRAWEAINVERDFNSVLAAVAQVVMPFAPLKTIALISFTDSGPAFVAGYLAGTPRGQCGPNGRPPGIMPPSKIRDRPMVQVQGSSVGRQLSAGAAYSCPDVLAKAEWFPHESKLAAVGVRAYVSLPLHVRGEYIGVATIGRDEPVAFTAGQIAVLTDIARPLAVAVANAQAYREIQVLRDQLQQENLALRSQLGQAPWQGELVGNSTAWRGVLERIEQVAVTEMTVLIHGETGTGKEMLVRALHRRSQRAGGPLVKFNCGAVPDTLLASELFGHERGAFTGAGARRKGRFEEAQDGTLFLDEIAELTPATQVMLLRALQEREIERLGSSTTVKVNARLVVATNRDLMQEVKAGRFRRDLFYRLNAFPIQVPPLRQRLEDVPLLLSHFVAKHVRRLGCPIPRVEPGFLRVLQRHDWPGNVRELENVVERALVMSPKGKLAGDASLLAEILPTEPLQQQISHHEREAIQKALKAAHGRVSGPNGAAKRLGVPPSTLDFRIAKLGIDKFQFRKPPAVRPLGPPRPD